jgi:type VI protein secretion system component VasK
VGAVFGGLGVALVGSRTAAVADVVPGDTWPWAVAAGLLFAFALVSNLWTRVAAHRRHRELARKIADGRAASEQLIRRADEVLSRRREDGTDGRRNSEKHGA